ncbi:MAG: DUF1538 family protein, partial [Acholeplasmataceae bacterium]
MIIKISSILKQSILSIGPLTFMVILFQSTGLVQIGNVDLIKLGIATLFLIFGMSMFNIGVNASVITMGELLGSSLTKIKRLVVIMLILFSIGFLVTAAEPSVAILARQVPIGDLIFITFVSVGAGLFLIIGVIRILFNRPINTLLMVGYLIVFVLISFADAGYIPMAFDSSAVTTGLMTVPFILAIGKGLAASHGNKNNQNDSFGLVGLVCIGPIIFVLLMGIIAGTSPEVVTSDTMPATSMLMQLMNGIGTTALSVLIILVPLLLFFYFYQLLLIKLTRKRLIRILVGSVWLFLGMVLFLAGANFGFISAGNSFGQSLNNIDSVVIVLIIVSVIGASSVVAEPSVHIMGEQ